MKQVVTEFSMRKSKCERWNALCLRALYFSYYSSD